MKFVLVLLVVVIQGTMLTLLSGLATESVTPYINEISASSKDMNLITEELKTFNSHIANPILKEGNFPINIDFKKFEKEDEDYLAFALVREFDCEIVMNLSETWTKKKLRVVLYHELGHCFGLEHDNPAAVMNDTLSNQAEELRSLPILYKEIDKKKSKKMLISRSGNEKWDSFVNEQLNILYPENKDDLLKQIPIKMSKGAFIFKPDESKKIIYLEN